MAVSSGDQATPAAQPTPVAAETELGPLDRRVLEGLSRDELETRLLAVSKVNEDLRQELAASERTRARLMIERAQRDREAPAPDPTPVGTRAAGRAGPGSGRPIAQQARPETIEPTRDGIRSAVSRWAAAWQEQRVDDYLDSYSEEFFPPDSSRAEWTGQRRQRISTPESIEVTISDLRVSLDQGVAHARFRQSYRADHYSDVVDKRLVFELEEGNWKIVEETSLGKVE